MKIEQETEVMKEYILALPHPYDVKKKYLGRWAHVTLKYGFNLKEFKNEN